MNVPTLHGAYNAGWPVDATDEHAAERLSRPAPGGMTRG